MIVRTALLLVVTGCTTWAALIGPAAFAARKVSELSKHVAAGENFRPAVLQAILDTPIQTLGNGACFVPDLRGRMLIATRLAEIAFIDGDTMSLSRTMGVARDLARQLLICEPYDSVAWLAFYWSAGHLEGFGSKAYDRLMMSYRTGPLEGWIAFRRNPQAASVLGELPIAIRRQVLTEWRHLVMAWQFRPAASALQRATTSYREELLNERAGIPKEAWLGFARFLGTTDTPFVLPDVPPVSRR